MSNSFDSMGDLEGAPAPADGSGGSRPARLSSPDRVAALTDGVFAIVLTLLVLEIAVPENLSEASLRQVLEELRPTVVAWVISFLITAMYWVAHRDLFLRIRAVNRDLVWLNLLFLLPVSLIPFASSVLGKYSDDAIALHLFGFHMIVASLMRLALYSYVIRRPTLLRTQQVPERIGLGLAIAAAPILGYALAMIVADSSAAASLILYFAVPILYFLLVTVLRDRKGTESEASEFT